MRDLKHLIYFENLLENSNNELIQQAQQEGKKAIGHVCYQIPEPLLNLPGLFSVRLRAPRTTSTEMGNYYLSPIFCEACRAILERALEGGFNFLDGVIAPEACAMMNRCVENIEHLGCCPREGFFASYCDVPMKSDDLSLKHYVLQMQEHCLKPLHEHLGVDISDAAIRKAVEEQNEISRLITEIGEYRKEESPRITGYEFAIFCLATYCCPKYLILDKLRETAEELKTRVPDPASKYRARVAMVGSEIDDPSFIKLAEDTGLVVVADRYFARQTRDRAHRRRRRSHSSVQILYAIGTMPPLFEHRKGERTPCVRGSNRKRIQGGRHHHRTNQILRLLGLRQTVYARSAPKRIRLSSAFH